MRTLICTMLLVVAGAAGAADTVERKPLALAAVAAQQNQIRADVIKGEGRYAALSLSQRSDLLAKQASLMAMIEGKVSTDDLSEAERIKAFNTLEWISATINQEQDDRMVCRRERTIGSNRVTRVCRTVEEERLMKEEAQRRLNDRGGRLMGG